MTRARYALAIAILAVMAIAAAWLFVPGDEKSAIDLSLSKQSDNGVFVVSLEPERTPVQLGEMQAWVIKLAAPTGEPVDRAVIAIEGGMPEHHHGLPTKPEITGNPDPGQYRLEGLKFTMNGWWQLKLSISTAQEADSVTFNLQL